MMGGCSEVEEKGNLIFLHINFIFLKKKEKNGWMYGEMRWMCLMMHGRQG